MESQSTSYLSCQNNQRVKFTLSVDTLHVRKQCRLPRDANLSILFQVEVWKKTTLNYPFQPHSDRDWYKNLKDKFTFHCSMESNTHTEEYKAKFCKVVLLTRYEMYGKHGYKSLARSSIPLHDLLPSLLSSTGPVSRTFQFDTLEGISVVTSWSAELKDEVAKEATAQHTICDLQKEVESHLSPARSSIANVGTNSGDDEAQTNGTDASAAPSSPESRAVQLQIPVDDVDDTADMKQDAPPPQINKTMAHQATQTSTVSDDSVDEQIAAYLELAVENDELVRSLITVKMDHAMLANEVDALRKYNYTLEQRLLKFYRKSNDNL